MLCTQISLYIQLIELMTLSEIGGEVVLNNKYRTAKQFGCEVAYSIGDRRSGRYMRTEVNRLLHQKTRRRLVLLCGLIGGFLVTANTLKRDYQTLVVLTGAWTRRRLVLTN